MGEIDDLRARIDDLDVRLVALLNERAACALAIGLVKEREGLPLYQPSREAEVLSRVCAANAGPLDDGAIGRLFERIIDEARRLERIAAGDRQHGAEPPGRTVDRNDDRGEGGAGDGAGE